MKLTSTPEILLRRTEPAYERAVQDTVELAQQLAVKVSGKWSKSITSKRISTGTKLVSHIGSPLSSARAHEKGAFIVPKNAPRLVFTLADGQVRSAESVRLTAQPAVLPAGARYPELMTKRLREMQP
jgi:hypothetical protein